MVKIVGKDSLTQSHIQQAAAASQAHAPAGEVTLDTLPVGLSGTITHITAEAGLKLHLMELGFVAGSSITYLMPTPFGDPHIFSLRGTSMALRKSEAKCIHVRI
jgi:ferrous iron transport protein A